MGCRVSRGYYFSSRYQEANSALHHFAHSRRDSGGTAVCMFARWVRTLTMEPRDVQDGVLGYQEDSPIIRMGGYTARTVRRVYVIVALDITLPIPRLESSQESKLIVKKVFRATHHQPE